MTVARMQEEMTSREFSEWRAYFKLQAEDEENRRQRALVEAALDKENRRNIGRRR